MTITFFDYRNGKPPKFIGKYETSACQFIETQHTRHQLMNDTKNVGQLWFNNLEVVQIPTFADCLKSGLQMNMITAIDFTGSNGSPSYKSSLFMNQYQQCIYPQVFYQ